MTGMTTSSEGPQARRLLEGLESGLLSARDAAIVAEDIDPVLVYVIVSFLRAVYPVSDPAAGAVLERVVRLTSSNPVVVRRHRQGSTDPIARWFESEYAYADFRGRGHHPWEFDSPSFRGHISDV